MLNLLHIDSSPRTGSASSRLAAAFVSQRQQQNPGGQVTHHNTTRENIPYLDEAMVDAYFTPPAALTHGQKRILACSDKFVDELLAADVVVIGAPMWNLSIPASLKAWIDMIVREGRTFAFAAVGVVPLLPPGKKVYVFAARGGAYPAGSPFHSLDHQKPYLRAILNVIGLTDIEFIHAEHLSEGPAAAAEGLAVAQRLAESIAA